MWIVRAFGFLLPLIFQAEFANCQGLIPPDGGNWVRRSSPSRPQNSCGPSSRCVRARFCDALRNEVYVRLENLSRCGRRGREIRVCCPVPGPTIENLQNDNSPDAQQDQPSAPRPGANQDCGRSITSRAIRPFVMGGEDATEGQFPWMVALTRRSRRSEFLECGAALIDSRHLLTAAHCFRNNNPQRYRAWIGALNWREGSSYDIVRITVHPGYTTGQFYDDIAVLTLAQEVTDPRARYICLPDEEVSTMRLVGQGTTVAGWGTTTYRGDESRTLKYVSAIPVMGNSECQTRLERLVSGFRRQFPRGLTRGFICAGFMEGGKDSCGGDSGGPLMMRHRGRYYAIGVVSFGFDCGRPGFPAGYTRVSEYADFIRRSTQD